ncbi:hypothetical protein CAUPRSCDRAFT_12161 [Caulochytrium protostelioides]|uniref:Uncharacterized protein n=1 Tax=Caulochytrium protostelioides TaxID=1555241 RepID=A0A4P9WTX7_9FUNG|nr:hypothetical protein CAUPRSCDRAFT_12161 [Caulochytrium protostelioides]
MRRDPPPLCMLPARPLGPPRHRRHVHAHPADPPAAGAGSDAVGGFADGILDDDDLDDDGDDDVDDDRQDDQDHPSDSDAPHDPYGDEAPRSARSSASYHQHHHHHHPSHPGDHAVPTDRDRVSNKTDRPRGKALLDYPEPAVTMMNAAEHWQSHAPPESHECRFHIRGLRPGGAERRPIAGSRRKPRQTPRRGRHRGRLRLARPSAP